MTGRDRRFPIAPFQGKVKVGIKIGVVCHYYNVPSRTTGDNRIATRHSPAGANDNQLPPNTPEPETLR